MREILSAKQMKEADLNTIRLMGLPSMVLMERASLAVVDAIEKEGYDLSRVCVVAGIGNNGGDGVAIARLLAEKGLNSTIYMVGDPQKYSDQLKQQIVIAKAYHVEFTETLDVDSYSLLIDAIFGIGLHREITDPFYDAIELINSASCPVVAVDIASGIHTDTGKVLGIAVKADMTVTFARAKRGHYFYPGAAFTGKLLIEDIGIPVDYAKLSDGETRVYEISQKDLKSLPERDPAGNKGTFGKVLVIAGSRDMLGAAYFSAHAALSSGAGMVRIYTPECNRTGLTTLMPEALLSTYDPENIDERSLENAMKWADITVIGPGLGTSAASIAICENFFKKNRKPCIIDADACNILAEHPELYPENMAYAVFTPHMGEMSRLCGSDIPSLKEDPLTAAECFSGKHGCICVLKDARSVITDGRGAAFLNTSGCSAMATAGSGDVLTGIIAALGAQEGLDAYTAALAVYVHGLCGQKAEAMKSQRSVCARDLISALETVL